VVWLKFNNTQRNGYGGPEGIIITIEAINGHII